MVAYRGESCHDMGGASSAAIVALWDSKHKGTSSITSAAITATGPTGENAIQSTGGSRWVMAYDSAATAYAGGWFTLTAVPSGTTEWLDIRDGTVTHLTYAILTDGSIRILRGGAGGTTLATSAAGVVVAGSYDHYAFKHLIADAGGTAEVLKNGVSVVSFSGDTRNGGTAASTLASFYPVQSTNGHWAHLYAGDTGGHPGQGKFECLHPGGNGNSSVLVGSDGNSTDNYLLVDETVPNDDTDYVTSGTPGDKDTYAMANLATTSASSIPFVQVNLRQRKDDAGVRSTVSVLRLSGTEADGPVTTLGTSYVTDTDVRSTKPGGGAWTVTDVNNTEAGVKINA